MKVVAKIEQDNFAESPRTWGQSSVMVCEHKRYDLGDEQFSSLCASTWREWFADYISENFSDVKLDENDFDDVDCLNDSGYEKIWKWIDENLVYLPLFLYDHSGITMSTGEFSCSWDSGQVGYIFITKEDAEKEYGLSGLSDEEKVKKTKEYLEGEVETYDMYLTGDVYTVVAYEVDDDVTLEDAECQIACGKANEREIVGGYYGLEYAIDAARDEFGAVEVIKPY